MPTPTVGQTITDKQNDQVRKGTALVVAAGHVLATAQDSSGSARISPTPTVVPVANVLTAS